MGQVQQMRRKKTARKKKNKKAAKEHKGGQTVWIEGIVLFLMPFIVNVQENIWGRHMET